jgi:hypothetical protein
MPGPAIADQATLEQEVIVDNGETGSAQCLRSPRGLPFHGCRSRIKLKRFYRAIQR